MKIIKLILLLFYFENSATDIPICALGDEACMVESGNIVLKRFHNGMTNQTKISF